LKCELDDFSSGIIQEEILLQGFGLAST